VWVTLAEIIPEGSPCPKFKRAFVVCNESAGSVAKGDNERLIAVLRELGLDTVKSLETPFRKQALRHATKDDLIVVLGGDGTARSVASAAQTYGDPVLILLPGGTLNMLPRALYGERAWEEALRAALVSGLIERLTGGRANGKAFYVAAIFGAPTLAARVREAVREGEMLRAWRRFRVFMTRAFSRTLRARSHNNPWRRAEAVGVLGPSFSGETSPNNLEWVRFEGRGLPDLLGLGLRAVADDWRRSPSVEIEVCEGGDIVSIGAIPATLDGEPKSFHGRVRVEMMRRGPRVLMQPKELR